MGDLGELLKRKARLEEELEILNGEIADAFQEAAFAQYGLERNAIVRDSRGERLFFAELDGRPTLTPDGALAKPPIYGNPVRKDGGRSGQRRWVGRSWKLEQAPEGQAGA